MTSFLLEIYGEEIPSWAQRQAENQLMILFKEFLAANQILFSEFQSFSTSRRISLIIKKIKSKVSDEIIEIRGPAVGSNEKAIDGFLKKNHSKVNYLVKKKTKGKEYFFLLIKTKRLTLNKLFEKEIPLILKKIRWKKSMRWNSFEDRWIRPIKNIMCILEKERIEFEYGGVKSTNYTFGNYHFDKTMVKIDKIEDYEKKLKDNLVIVSRAQRQKVIANKLDSFCKNKKLDLIINEELFEGFIQSMNLSFQIRCMPKDITSFIKSYLL